MMVIDKYKLIGIFVLQAILIILLFDPKIFMGGDSHTYFNLAQSIREGNGYREIWTPENNLNSWIPPLFPLILVPFSHNYLAVKGLIILLTLLSTYLIWQLFKNWAVLLLFISNLAVLEFSHYELTEIPYLICVLATFYFWREDRRILFIISLISAFYMRSEGIILGLTFLLYGFFCEDKFRFLKIAVIYGLAIVPWFIYSHIAGNNMRWVGLLQKNIYQPELGNIGWFDFIPRIVHNFNYYFMGEGGNVLLNFHWIFTLPLMIIAFYGLIKKGGIFLLFVVLHYLLLLCWQPMAIHWRYALAVSPFLIFGFVNGFEPALVWTKKLFTAES